MAKIKITESEFRKLVREEGEKIKKEIILRAQLEKIDEELKRLDEVHAGGEMAPGESGVHAGQKKPVFTKKGTHLVEDEEDVMEMGDDSAEEFEVTNDEGTETLSKEDVIAAIQDLGNKLDLTGTVEFSGEEEEMGDDSGMELDVDVEDGVEDVEAGEEIAGEEAGEEVAGEDTGEDAGEEEMGDESGTEETLDESKKPMEKTKLNEEVSRWKFLAGIK